ncbi:MAG: nucleoside monophosphate kinase [Candidatus Saccharimonadales bacterium]
MEAKIEKIAAWLGTGSIDIFGRPFAGKDTQGRILADLFGGILIAGGDILRSHHDPTAIEQVMASGGIIPSDFYLQLVLPYFSRPDLKAKPLILSAVGRSAGEETAIMEATRESGHPMRAVVVLQLTEEAVWQRFEASQAEHDRGERTDDHREVLKTRLQKYQDKTVPVIEFYRDQGLLIEVDGTKPRREVTNEILQALASRATT